MLELVLGPVYTISIINLGDPFIIFFSPDVVLKMVPYDSGMGMFRVCADEQLTMEWKGVELYHTSAAP